MECCGVAPLEQQQKCALLQDSAKSVAMYCLQTCKSTLSGITVAHAFFDVQRTESSLSCFPSVHDCSLVVCLCNICVLYSKPIWICDDVRPPRRKQTRKCKIVHLQPDMATHVVLKHAVH
ncbi:TPA: hypothetical protein ACH3X1_003356 [Trebouxia sp. C0004]